MTRALSITATGLRVFERWLDVKAANLAGNGVDGFKSMYMVATDLPSEDELLPGGLTSDAGTVRPIGHQVGLGAKVVGTYRNFSKGTLINTGNALDIAIDGAGFFKITLSDGSEAYTRASALQTNGDGMIVTPEEGHIISPGIQIPIDAISMEVNPQGVVSVLLKGQQQPQILGQIETATFLNPSGLRALGNGLYMQTDASGNPDLGIPGTSARGKLQAGFREGSNVNSVQEITDLIKIEKGFGFLTKILNIADSMAESMKGVGR
jgi:flagellar basal-body rod protein FlgG